MPRKRSLTISIAYMLPQPPLTSRTASSWGASSRARSSKIERSLASSWSGGVRGAVVVVVVEGEGEGEEELGDDDDDELLEYATADFWDMNGRRE